MSPGPLHGAGSSQHQALIDRPSTASKRRGLLINANARANPNRKADSHVAILSGRNLIMNRANSRKTASPRAISVLIPRSTSILREPSMNERRKSRAMSWGEGVES